MDLIERNTEEVVTEEEIESLLEQSENPETDDPRAYVGYETSGPAHLGHMTSVQKLLDVQEAGFEPVVLWADKHTKLNEKGEAHWDEKETLEWIDGMTDYWQATFESLGLDAEFVRGTDFQHGDYMEDVLELGTETTMNRATNSMGDIASNDSLSVAQAGFYPLMQTMDIPHLDIDLAMGGIDQRGIHMKLARDKLPEVGYDKPAVVHYPLLTSLQGEGTKMSSSKPETMFPLHAGEETVKERIEGADFDPQDPVDENPVLQIANRFIFGADQNLHVVNDKYDLNELYDGIGELYEDTRTGEVHPEDIKVAVGEEMAERLKPVRSRFQEEPELLAPLEKAGYERPGYVE